MSVKALKEKSKSVGRLAASELKQGVVGHSEPGRNYGPSSADVKGISGEVTLILYSANFDRPCMLLSMRFLCTNSCPGKTVTPSFICGREFNWYLLLWYGLTF